MKSCGNASHLAETLAAARAAEVHLRSACDLAAQAVNALSSGLQTPLRNAAEDAPVARHRSLHRPGVLSKIEADLAVRDFILARISTMTFAEIIAACAEAFPPDRRPSHSGLHRWWHRQGKPTAEAIRQIALRSRLRTH